MVVKQPQEAAEKVYRAPHTVSGKCLTSVLWLLLYCWLWSVDIPQQLMLLRVGDQEE